MIVKAKKIISELLLLVFLFISIVIAVMINDFIGVTFIFSLLVYFLLKHSKRDNWLLAIFFTALSIRIVFICIIDTPIISDFKLQFDAAMQFAEGNMEWSTQPYFMRWGYQCGWVIFEGFVLKIWNNPLSIKVVNSMLDSANAIMICKLTEVYYGRTCSHIGGLLYAIFPFPVFFVSVLGSQQAATFFVLCSLYVLLKETSSVSALMSGGLMAIAQVLKPDVIPIFAAIFVSLFLNIIFNKETKRILIYFVFSYMCLFFIVSNALVVFHINTIGLRNTNPLLKIVFGLNHETGGGYSSSDWNIVENAMVSGKHVNEIELQMIFERLRAPLPDMIMLFCKKIEEFWNGNVLFWSIGHLGEKYGYIVQKINNFNEMMWLFILTLGNIGNYFFIKEAKDDYKRAIIPLGILATFLIYLLIEVQGRYRYLIQALIFVAAAKGISCIQFGISEYILRCDKNEK